MTSSDNASSELLALPSGGTYFYTHRRSFEFRLSEICLLAKYSAYSNVAVQNWDSRMIIYFFSFAFLPVELLKIIVLTFIISF